MKKCIIVIYSDMRDWTDILSEENKIDDSRDEEEAERQPPPTSPIEEDALNIWLPFDMYFRTRL